MPASAHPIWPRPLPPGAVPTMYDLPSEDPEEPGLPDEFHSIQPHLLRETFQPPGQDPAKVFVATDLNLYYDLAHPLWHKRPDWFAVLGADRLYEQQELRLSYVIWQERVTPSVVVELLSPGTEDEDLGQTTQAGRTPPSKWAVYERILGVPYYLVYSRYTNELQVFILQNGRYRPAPARNNRFWFETLGLGAGLWSGVYQQVRGRWLRWYDASGAWIPTPEEAQRRRANEERRTAEAERARADEERRTAEAERARANEERQRAEAAEQEIARLRAALASFQSTKS